MAYLNGQQYAISDTDDDDWPLGIWVDMGALERLSSEVRVSDVAEAAGHGPSPVMPQ